ncbi:MAG: type II and III secretion system protein family protein [Caulobacteraceae bacterium]
MPVSRSGAALAPFALLIMGAAAAALPGPGHAQAPAPAPAAPAKAAAAVPPAASPKPAAPAPAASAPAATAPAKPAEVKPVIHTADAKPAPARSRPAARPAAPVEPGVLYVDLSTAGGSAKTLNLPNGKSAMVDLPSDVRDVLVTNPAVADAMVRGRRRISVIGVAAGDTDAVFFDEAGKRILTLDIHVSKDSSGLADAFGRIFPGSKVRVEGVNDSLVLSGEVSSTAEAGKAVQLAQRFVTKPEQVVNLLTITGKEQVMLKVRIVELQRTMIKQLGFNLNALTGQLGMSQYGFANAPSYGVNGGFLGGATGGYSLNTTSQPTAFNPFSSLGAGSGAIGSLAQAAGVNPGNMATVVGNWLTGTGAINAAQTAFSQNFLSGLVSSLGGYPSGITADNLPSFDQRFLAGDATLTGAQKTFLQGFNSGLPNYNQSGYYSLQAAQGSTWVDRNNPANPVANGRAGSTGLNQAQAMIQAFERVGLVRTLAEPNLTAISGESAKFLAGGEYPVPTGEDTTGRVSIEFKPYGVGLNFTPVVMSGGRISLKIATEVSELSNDGSFTISAGGGNQLTIPALKLRRTETTVELPSGGAMMIGGLLQQQTKENIDSLPGLKDLPVLGALFRSRDYLSGETELAIIVTPYLVNSTSPDQLQTPIDGLQFASDLETDLLGKLNKASKVPPAATAGKSLQGPYGYVIE